MEMVLGLLHRLSADPAGAVRDRGLALGRPVHADLAAFLVRSLREARVLLLATYRSDELDRRHRLRPLLTGWERTRSVNHIDVRRFDQGEVTAQLAAILGAAPASGVTEVIFDRSGGNAYLVEELAGALSGGGDPSGRPLR